jgi:signal transduction histidine kinase
LNPLLVQRLRDRTLPYVEQLPGTPTEVAAGEDDALRKRLMRLAFDVHDGPMQSLIAVAFRVRELQRTVADADAGALDGETAARELNEMLGELTSTEASLRNLITALEHGHPEIETIDEILANEVASFRRRSRAVVTVSAPSFQPDSASQAIAIKAVLRESLSNIAKHANASAVSIVVDRAPNGILVEVEDDGVGFDVAGVRQDAIGLLSMEQRVALLDGDFTVLSRPGGPTVVSACFERWFDGAAAA